MLLLLVSACSGSHAPPEESQVGETTEALLPCNPISCTAGTACIHLRVVDARSDGGQACAFAQGEVAPSSVFFAKYGYSLQFDPNVDYEDRADNSISDDCTLQVPEANLVNYRDSNTPPPCDYDANERARLALAGSYPDRAVILDAATRRPIWNASQGHWTFAEYSNHSWATDGAVQMSGAGAGLSFAHELGHYLHLPHTFLGKYTAASLSSAICANASGLTLQQAYQKVTDGDSPDVLDTSADPGIADAPGVPLMVDTCNAPTTQLLPVTCNGQTQQVAMSPDRFNIMSYYAKLDCSGNQVPTMSAGQRARIDRATHLGNRRQLLGFSPWVQSMPVLTKVGGMTSAVLANVSGGMSLRNLTPGQAESHAINPQNFPGDLVEDSVATLGIGNQLHVFGRKSSGTIAHKVWNGSAWVPAAQIWDDLGGTAAGKPAVISMGGSDLDVFVRFTDNTIQHKALRNGQWWPSATTWENLGSTLVSDPAVVSWGPNRIDIIARGGDNAIWRKVWNGTSWWPSTTGWDSLSGQFTDSPAIISRAVNTLDMVGRGSNGELWYKAWTGTAWDPPAQSVWRSLGGSIQGSPSITSWGSNRLDIAVRGSDGHVWRKLLNGTSWWPSLTGWDSLGGNIVKSPVVFAEGVNLLRYYVVGQDGSLYSKSWNGTAWLPSDWTYLGRE